MSVQFLSPFIDWVIWFFGVKFFEFLEFNALSEMHMVKILSHSVGSLFTVLIVSFAEKKLFSFNPSYLLILDFTSCALGVLLRKSDPRPTW